jgi:hypothetical protein
VTLTRDGVIQANYTGKKSVTNLMATYDCSKPQQTFVLTTTGGYGPQATKQRTVSPQ